MDSEKYIGMGVHQASVSIAVGDATPRRGDTATRFCDLMVAITAADGSPASGLQLPVGAHGPSFSESSAVPFPIC
jgi:hypothetical protein